MGNHEYTQIDSKNQPKNVDPRRVIKECREFCQSHDIIFLHNELLLYNDGYSMILDTQSILNSSYIQLSETCSQFDAILFGGTGFEKGDPYYGLTKDVHITNEIMAVHSQDVEIFQNVYQRLLDVFKNDDRIIVMTHYPPSAWLDGSVCPNWVYFHGHTHQDNFIFNDSTKIFGDNQWGHDGTRDGLKHYCKGFRTDIFAHCEDGIYEISREKYLSFYRHLGQYCEMNRKVQIIMLKREGFYLFLYEDDRKRLKILEGGRAHPLEKETIAHVYDNMVYMAQKMLGGTSNIRKQMTSVSEYIRSFGGTGTIHGCIVDIDFFNHVYVNPYDGTITPYYASDMANKIVYPELRSLLLNRVPSLVGAFDDSASKQKGLIKINSGIRAEPNGTPYKDTDIYAISNKMRNAQYLVDCNIVRYWIPDEVTEANRSDTPIEIRNYDTLVEGWPKPRLPFVLSSESYNFRSKLKTDIIYNIQKGELSQDDLRNIIKERCSMMREYDTSRIDSVVNSLCCELLDVMKLNRIALTEGSHKPVIAESSEEQTGIPIWKQIYDALQYIQLDFSEKILDYLLTESGASLASHLNFKSSGKHSNDLKKIYRIFFLGNKGGTFIKYRDGGFSFYRPGRDDVNLLIEDYLEGRLTADLPIFEKIVCPARYYPDIYRHYGFNLISAFKNMLRIDLVSDVDWISDMLKLLCASILREQYEGPGVIDYIGSYLFSENNEFDRQFEMFAGDSICAELPQTWVLLLEDRYASDYLTEYAKIYHI